MIYISLMYGNFDEKFMKWIWEKDLKGGSICFLLPAKDFNYYTKSGIHFWINCQELNKVDFLPLPQIQLQGLVV